jgi:geranylgeranyl diphosphate synthase type I
MIDVKNGALTAHASDILDLYRKKTGRYTFSLPLAIGAFLAGAENTERLSEAGEYMGILFQLKDDELGIFASEAVLGKPIGADIRENKKTVYREHLFALSDSETRQKLKAIFGNQHLEHSDLEFVRSKIQELDIEKKIHGLIDEYTIKANTILKPIIDKSGSHIKNLFEELLDYIIHRQA